jgi:hypothetical protein
MCVKREEVKVEMFECGAARLIAATLTAPHRKPVGGLVRDVCLLLSRMLTDDDYAVEASKAYNYARLLAGDGIVAPLLEALREHAADP